MEIKDVENLAELARIELSLDEKKEILEDMNSILAYVKQIEEVPVGDIESSYALKNIWREDESGERSFSKEVILKQFPDSSEDFLKVKKIL